jgi:phospholipid/cholesterol/gamma-HCH transport system permease protein
MGVHPVDYLVLPRLVAMIISMPLLVAESIVFGLLTSYVMAVHGFEVPHAWYWPRTLEHTNMEDLSCGMIKGFVFGILITLISCHQGLKAENGAVGVGLGTTRAVVVSSLVLLVTNLFLSILLNYFFPLGSL